MAERVIQNRHKRIKYKAAITLKDKRTGYHYPGTLQNYSKSGLYFESTYAQRPGRKICITSDSLPFSSSNNGHLAKVIWRKLLTQKQSTQLFGVGVKFC